MSTALAPVQTGAGDLAIALSNDDMAAIRAVYGKGLDDAQFKTFVLAANHNGYDVAKGEYKAINFGGTWSFMATVHGIVNKAHRNPMLEGIEGPYWCGPDGQWVDIWLKPNQPTAAKVIVYRKDKRFPYVGLALWEERKQSYFKDGKEHLMPNWKKMPAHMLAKVAKTDALKASNLIGDEPVWIEEDDDVEGSTVRVVENQVDNARRHLHGAVSKSQLGGHSQARALAAQLDPNIQSLTEASPTVMHDAGDLAQHMPDYARDLIAGRAKLTDPPGASVVDPVSNERAIWRGEIEAALPWSKESAQQFMNQARAEPWRFEDLIALSPAPIYLEKFRTAAMVAKVDPATIQRAERAYHDREQIATERMRSAPLAELTVATWNDLWQVLKVKGIEHASFVDVLGRNTDTFASAQDALTAYVDRLASIDASGDDFADVDTETGEIIDVAVQSPTLFDASDPDRFTK